jgi:hypothetical protein
MSSFDWESLLRQWSRAILASITDEEKRNLPQGVLDFEWLGFPGATEAQIARTEARLKRKLPPSYREFLKLTNGWRQTAKLTDPFNHRFWSVEAIQPFGVRHVEWIKSVIEQNNQVEVSVDDEFPEITEKWESVGITDEEYLVYGEAQDPSKLRLEYLKPAIEISDVSLSSSIYLLNPEIVNSQGEWEAWVFAGYMSTPHSPAHADRYPSFWDLMQAEYQSYLELCNSSEAEEREECPTQEGTLISEEEVKTASGQEASDPPEPVGARPETRIHLPLTSPPGPENSIAWQSLKRLTVEFQRRQVADQIEYRTVVNAGAFAQSQAWSGLTEKQLLQWLQENLGRLGQTRVESGPSETAISTPSEKFAPIQGPQSSSADQERKSSQSSQLETAGQTFLPVSTEVLIEITQIEIYQIYPSNRKVNVSANQGKLAKSTEVGPLISHYPFSMKVEFRIEGLAITEKLISENCYILQVYLKDQITGEWKEFGKTQPLSLEAGPQIYTSTLSFQPLQPGLYTLLVVTRLSGAVVALASFELPRLMVI